MDTFAEALAAKVESVCSPDRNITVTLKGGVVTNMDFATGAYSRYSESVLEEQIISLIKLVIVARNRSRKEAIYEELGHDVSRLDARILSKKEVEFKKRVENIEVEAHSRRISIIAQPLGFWDVQIKPNSLKESTGAGFIDEILSVVSEVISNMNLTVARENNTVFGHVSEITPIHHAYEQGRRND